MSEISACACAQAQLVSSREDAADTCAIIVAGGSGERFGDPRGKQFVELGGLPIAAWSILAFSEAPSVAQIVVVCSERRVREMRRDVLDKLELCHEVVLAPAGVTRQDSVFSGLMASRDDLPLVAIHDAARPLIEVETIENCLAAVRSQRGVDGAICASRSTDTLKVVDESGRIVGTPDRARYWCAMTPQVFLRSKILRAHEMALLQGFEGTDDASLVEHAGGTVRVVESPRDNIKITVPEDLAIAEATLQARLGTA
ncbi:MAG: 2-C-methyl-D-erythritol 4-phosphate cytidylyltransferase [Atopobiaceae bacterium]|nr:2-C-methyl-D-erythritol 4-phosphate cytidylyltransferase [Atopobiaceae bacterium]